MSEALDQAKSSLKRIQEFDASSLVRENQLGRELNFQDAVGPAHRIIDLSKRLPIEILDDLTDRHLAKIKIELRQYLQHI